MRFARGLLIFAYGLFTIAAQTLLFREFLTTFEGNDISVGIFFGSWFLWIALGAALVNRVAAFADKLLENIEFVLLAFLPAFILEWILIVQAREIAGVESYALLSVRAIVFLSIVINAPVSIITGMFFPIACRWVRQDGQLAVSRVYIIEAAGSFIGGLGTTILLGLGTTSAMVFLLLALVVSLATFCVQLVKARRWYVAFVPVCIMVCLIAGADRALMRQIRVMKWNKLLAQGELQGSFQTAQAEYLYGTYQGQWVAIREGSTCEALPDRQSAGRIAAIGLCQNPQAERVLVVGSGLGLCYEFLRLPGIEHVTWAHCDSQYVQEVDKFVPEEFRISGERFSRVPGDVRSWLIDKKHHHDLVVINLPDATSSVLNRYYTLEFYRQVKESLADGGVLAVRVAGGENIMGTELINLGASTKLTLEKVFSKLVLTPGEETWFIASDSDKLTGDPATLRGRFAAIAGASDIFPPDGLLSVYLPDRAATALQNYASADLPERMLLNRDSRPLTHLYSLLLAAKQSGAPGIRLVKYLASAGPLVFVIPILVFVVLRGVYVLSSAARGAGSEMRASSFDSSFLIFSAGLVGIGAVIVLMYMYQTRFGSLYLHIGVISSLFMVGLTFGAAVISRLLSRRAGPETWVTGHLFAVVIAHMLILGAIAFWPAEQQTHLAFAIGFNLLGICAGAYFPVAARQLADSGFQSGQVGSKLETADHIGASAGGLLTGLVLVPVLGASVTLFIFGLLLLAAMPAFAVRIYKPADFKLQISDLQSRLRRLGYVLFGIGASIILCSNLVAAAAAKMRPSLPEHAAQALAGEANVEAATAVASDTAREIRYFKVCEAEGKPAGYIFSSEDLAPEVRGFGGKMNLAVYVDPNGRLINFHVIRSNETPAYMDMLSQWRDGLNGRQLFQPQPFADVQAVTGATVSSEAILAALQTSGHRFATQILGYTIGELSARQAQRAKYLPDSRAIYLIAAFMLALVVTYHGGFWSRLVVLSLNLVVGGIILNAQYSSEQITSLLSFHNPAIGLSGVFLLAVGVPLLVVFFGNMYCGYICPFGAMQELIGYIVPQRAKDPPAVETMRKARFVKYVILFVLIAVFFLSRDKTTLATDPLISVFNIQLSLGSMRLAIASWRPAMLLVVAIALIGSLFYVRFWCRYFCPVGAFLSLLNKAVLLKRHVPAKRFGRCEFGLTARDNLDCIFCDRCRYQLKTKVQAEPVLAPDYSLLGLLRRYFVVVVLCLALFVSTFSVGRFLQVIPVSADYSAAYVSSGGQPRDVDLQRIRTMIRQKELSEREAEYYKKVE